jgi:hypothetical protein
MSRFLLRGVLFCGVVFAGLALLPDARGAEPQRWVLSSASENRRTETFHLDGSKLTPQQPNWRVHLQTLHGGRQEGCELLVVDNGRLRITLIPTRGMSVLDVVAGDLRLGWKSPVAEVVHPREINLHSRGGLGWLEGFNEWMVRCGLESNGHPGTDKLINNTGDEASLELTLHGRIGNIPASEVELLVDPAPPHRITVRGTVWERSFYGPHLKLQTELSTEPGSLEFRISDTITNHGAQEQEFEILYHANYGAPLLEAGAEFLAPVKRVVPFNAHAAKSVAKYATFAGPTVGFTEEVYCLYPLADEKNHTLIALRNKAGDRGASIAFNVQELPHLTLWKNTAATEDGYVTGLEPGTNFPNNRRIERKLGRVPKLAPGATRTATLDFALLPDATAVKGTAERIARLQSRQKPVIETTPEKKE